MATAKNQTPQILVVDVATGTEILRDMTDEEIAQREIVVSEINANLAAIEAKAAARQSALAKLAELGLTEEEIAAL